MQKDINTGHLMHTSSIHEQVDGQNIGQHPLISRLLKGAFNQKPPTARYSHFWDVGLVLRFIRQLGENSTLSLKWISIKTAMLMALTRPSRSADLSKLDIRFWTYTCKGVFFSLHIYLNRAAHQNLVKNSFFLTMHQMNFYVQCENSMGLLCSYLG